MAGEVEEPFRLDFQADSLHSGSISFGRFESEALCWERRSSFSHNRYLEEVEKLKCSKPGSVTEKKAYFEAHFRKKGILGHHSPESQNETENQISEENDISEKMGCDEEINQNNAESHSPCFGESLDGREHELIDCERKVFGTSMSDPHVELSCDSTENEDCDPELGAKLGSVLSTDSKSGIEMKENLNGEAENLGTIHVSNVTIGLFPDNHATEDSSDASLKDQQVSFPKEKSPSEAEYTKPRLVPRVSVTQSRRYISSKASKSSEKKPSKIVNNILLRPKSERKTSEAAAQDKCPTHKTPEYELGSKAKGVDEIKRGEKESRNRRITEPQSSTLQTVSSRVHQSANRVNPAAGTTKQSTKQDGSWFFRLKCNERAERRKEFDIKLEEKIHAKEAEMHQLQAKTQEKTQAEIKQLRKSLNFKAKPLPSFYRGALRESDRNKAIASNVKPRKLRTKSSSTEISVSENSVLSLKAGTDQDILISAPPKATDPPHASGGTSSHSTVTSDSSPSSPAAENSNSHPSQAGINSPVCGKKEKPKGKHTNLHKNRAPESINFYKGKRMDGKKKTEN